MGIELYPATDRCPCGSGKEAQYCCIPLEPPVAHDPDIYRNLKFEFTPVAVDPRTQKKIELRPEHLPPSLREGKFSVTLRYPSQMDTELEDLAIEAHGSIRAPEKVDDWQRWEERAHAFLERVITQLYAARYHQRQFFARLRKVTARQSLGSTGTDERLIARFQDVPLKTELQAYLIRLLAVRDPVGQFGRVMLGFEPADRLAFRKFKNLVRSNKSLGDPLVKASLEDVLDQANWIEDAREMRNDIVHEGAFKAFRPPGQQGSLMLQAEIGEWYAGGFCIRTWKEANNSVEEILRWTIPLDRD